MWKSVLKASAAVAVGVTLSAQAFAATSAKEMQVVGKATSFATTIDKSAPVKVGIVYDAANAASKADFDAVMGIIGSGLKAGKVTLVAEPIAAGEISAKAGSVQVLFVTEGMSSAYADVSAAAKANKLLSISTDMACVESGNCLVGVDVGAGVKVLLNRAAVDAVGVEFDSAFKFMVKEV